jgi:hypothetical protein
MLLENKIAVISKAAAMGRPETRGPENIRYWCVSHLPAVGQAGFLSERSHQRRARHGLEDRSSDHPGIGCRSRQGFLRREGRLRGGHRSQDQQRGPPRAANPVRIGML